MWGEFTLYSDFFHNPLPKDYQNTFYKVGEKWPYFSDWEIEAKKARLNKSSTIYNKCSWGYRIEFSIPKLNTEPGLNQTGILSLCELKPTAQRQSDLGESL